MKVMGRLRALIARGGALGPADRPRPDKQKTTNNIYIYI